ncbi:hypothetical protein, partial [Staphylococcus haemolyticus]
AAIALGGALRAQSVGPVAGPGGPGIFGGTVGSQGAHVVFGGGPPPTLNAACGTSPGTVVGTDAAFHFTSGTGSSNTCRVTFAAPYVQTPTCSLDNQTNGATAYQVSASGITLSGVADSTVYHVQCFAAPGG